MPLISITNTQNKNYMSYYETLLLVYLSISAICCTVVSWCLPKYKNTPLVLAPVILWLGLLAEISGTLYSHFIEISNGWIFNSYHILYFILLYTLVYKYLKKANFKKWLFILGSLALLVHIYCFFSASSFNDRLIYANAFLVFVLLIACTFYMVELMQRKTSFDSKNHPELNLLGGYLIFQLIYTPLFVAFDMNLHIFSGEFYTFLFSMQAYVLIAMNLYFMYTFIWMKKAH